LGVAWRLIAVDPTQLTLGLAAIVLGYIAVGFAWLTLALRTNRSSGED
jgi:hypothetical protein